jgi:drug/metabolite transporter (DMT)-like permease
LSDLKNHPKLIIGQSILDNTAWVAFAVSTTHVPIAIATAISESYIALAVFLGLFLNHEKLRPHQMAGVALAVVGVIALSYL